MNQMDYVGKYLVRMPSPSGEQENRVLIRNYYDGSLHGMLHDGMGGSHLLSDLVCADGVLTFTAPAGPAQTVWRLTIDGDCVRGTVAVDQGDAPAIQTLVSGVKTAITPADDGAERDTRKKKALILYASITGNTEKIARCFQETFEHYDMEVTMVKVKNKTNWDAFEGKLYIEDYDVVCMGSLIIGGSPTTAIVKNFSAGAVGSLEEGVAKNAEAGLKFNAGGAGGPVGAAVKGAPPEPPKDDPGMRLMRMWHRPDYLAGKVSYPGGPDPHGLYYPLGIVFTTYGGGFRGSDEALPVLEMLRLYLEAKGTKVVGKFACCGKEFGPAGLDDGELPMGVKDPPVFYKDADGNYHAGSYFWHAHSNSRPSARDEAMARVFIANLVEDYFYTADGQRRDAGSVYTTIC